MIDRRPFIIVVLGALVAGSILRVAWLTADPPTHASVGIVWHDEGAWAHNARNRAIWGAWRTDNWNPMFIAPVFTALEFGAFSLWGVGTWQARTVPVASGLAAIVLLGIGLTALAGRRVGAIGTVLLATNYAWVMWNRAALMESTMTSLIVAGWACYAVAARRPAFGLLAGIAATLALFTKASAVFFVGALALDALFTVASQRVPALSERLRLDDPDPIMVRAAWWTLAGLALASVVAAVYVLPNWSEYRFYNWQMSVTRKPEYSFRALMDRASWLPIAHDFFTRMWLVTVAASMSLVAIAARWRRAIPAERLLVLWVLIGLFELIVHDSGNERRYVMFVPALVALAAGLLGRAGPVIPARDDLDRARWPAIPLLLLLAYLVFGSLVRLAFLYEIRPGVRFAAAVSIAAVGLAVWQWSRLTVWLSRQQIAPRAALLVVALAVAGDLAQYGQWVRRRTSHNFEASVHLGDVLAPGTLVHGKLANGLSLENAIRPVFVGRGFGNYDDRRTRDDVRYILTYIAPRLGYEGPVILDVLEAYPDRAVIMTFDVAETSSGHDKAALIDKFGGARAASSGRTGRAQN